MANKRLPDDLPQYSQLLRMARYETALTGADVAVALGVGLSTYTNAENGRGSPTVVHSIERVFPQYAEEIRAAYEAHIGRSTVPRQVEGFQTDEFDVPLQVRQALVEAGITRFHPSRKYYALLRDGRASISQYINQATETLEMVSITLATGIELERVIDTFEEMLTRREPVRIRISLLDPEENHLMRSIAPAILASPEGLTAHIRDSVKALDSFRKEKLSRRAKSLFEVWTHRSIPNFSAIIIDGDTSQGVLQLETKGYRQGSEKSFGLETAAPSEFFKDLRDSYRELMDHGQRVIPKEGASKHAKVERRSSALQGDA